MAAASRLVAVPGVTGATWPSSIVSCATPSRDVDLIGTVTCTGCHVEVSRGSAGKGVRRCTWSYGGRSGPSTSIGNGLLSGQWGTTNRGEGIERGSGGGGGRGGGRGGGCVRITMMAAKPGAVRPPAVEWREKREALLAKNVRSVRPSEALRLMGEGGYSLVDVRLASEHEGAHPEGAINVEMYRLIKEWTPWDIARRAAYAFFGIFKGTEENPDFVDEIRAKVGGEETPIIVACFQGGTLKPSTNFPEGKPSRSLTAACRLVQAGYTKVIHLDEGILGWFNDGLPVKE
ncbi:hypothetical protein CBR_g3780 [Chara braunii]|uniref:Rhodanese domain-containing protein n=1 Tax=Chara braunii TaxID=69332 RepID=A0A388KGA1_CHABU|nr:hypothetical protein CBR_g3780 [Chara braunii]|eukprot:GBG69082.1 hypothetical protein CBR_g3780 [Chara braunii]